MSHVASHEATFNAPPELIWKAITDVDAFPRWRSGVKRVERLPDRDGRTAWVEHGRNGRIPFVIERSEPPRILVVRIADANLPFGGTWTYELTPMPAGMRLTITERGEIYNALFRFMARYVFGYDKTIKDYMAALQAHVNA